MPYNDDPLTTSEVRRFMLVVLCLLVALLMAVGFYHFGRQDAGACRTPASAVTDS